jgi:uncharacterized RDD family membrane protein YckC
VSPGASRIPLEARPYQGHRAGVVSRFVAAAIDVFVVTLVLLGMYAGWATFLFLVDPEGFTFPEVPAAGALFIGFDVLVIYLTVAWALNGRTWGANVMGLRVVNYQGQRLRPVGAFLRAVFCAAFPIGLFWCVVSRQNRSVQDVVLRTSVVYDWQPGHGPQATTQVKSETAHG